MNKGTVRKIVTWSVVGMIAATFFFGGFGGLKTQVNDWLNPGTTTEQGE